MRIADETSLPGVREPRASDPPVDIGMPAYRRPQFIGAAIESVLAQTYSNWRLLVSENGPGGGDVEAAVSPYTSDPRIQYVATGKNLGPAVNWTRLLQAGTAPYFTVIQDDDMWDPGFLARRVAFLENHPSCGFVYSGDRQVDQNGRPIDTERTASLQSQNVADVLSDGVYSPEKYIWSLYRHKLGGIHPPSICSLGVMSRRTALEAVGPKFDETFPFLYFDVELYVRMALRFPTGFMAIRDATQRIHHPSITSEHNFDGEYWLRYHEYHESWFRRELPNLRLPRQYHQIVADAHIMASLDALERGNRRRCAHHLGAALRRSPSSIAKPRFTASAIGLALGGRGPRLLARARAARRRRSGELRYEH